MTPFLHHDNTHPKYRPDIDGLRAIAVLLVVVFHAFPAIVTGGFVGVDIFFVISGFLISTILFKSLDQQQFSLGDFYHRRIRRIFPALLLVLAATFAAGWFFLFPNELKEFGKDFFKGTLFVLNFRLMHDAGYFATASDLQPVLHLWSLCIEEQFYVVWPIMLYVLWKMPRKLRLPLMIMLILGSFAANIVALHRRPIWAFYLPVTRFWELWLGSLLAYMLLYHQAAAEKFPQRMKPALKALASLAGLALIFFAALQFKETDAFPGWRAALPTVGACLLIGAGYQHSVVNKYVLGNRLAVFIGLISYPLYLWHWPILSYLRIIFGDNLTTASTLYAVVASVILAWLTFQLVEKPLRFKIQSRKLPLVLLVLLALCAGLGYAAKTGALTSRFSTEKGDKIFAAIDDWAYRGPQFKRVDHEIFKLLKLQGREPEKVIMVGDSHAEHYWPYFENLYNQPNKPKYSMWYITQGGCPPLPHVNRLKADSNCYRYYDYALKAASESDTKAVVFSAIWETYLGVSMAGSTSTPLIYDNDDPSKELIVLGDPRMDKILADFENDIQHLRSLGKNVYIILSNPTSQSYNPKTMLSRLTGEISIKDYSRSAFEGHFAVIKKRFEAIAAHTGVRLIDPLDALCDGDVCPTTFQGKPVYKDNHHLRPYYAVEKGAFLHEVVE